MKALRIFPIVMILAGSTVAEEVDPFAAPDPNDPVRIVRVQLEYVETRQEDLTKLLFLEKPTNSDSTELRKRVQAMVEKKEAKIIDTQLLLTKSGNKASSESRHEFIYPTEYSDPPSLKKLKASKEGFAGFPSFPFNPTTPVAFETRNLGSTFECECTIGENEKIVDFRIDAEQLWHTGDTTWQEWEQQNGKSLTVRMPDFYVIAVNTAGICVSGQYSLISVVAPKDKNGEVDRERNVLVFLKCDVLEVK